MARFHPDRDLSVIFEGAKHWLLRCWENDLSAFSDQDLWTSARLEEVHRLFVEQPDASKELDFYEKLEKQLHPGTPQAKQLMAELVWLLLLFPDRRNIKPETKRKDVRTVWEWSGKSLPSGAEGCMGDDVLAGVGSTGQSFSQQRWREIGWFVGASRSFKAVPQRDRHALLSDPWRFAEWLVKLDGTARRQFPHILRCLAFPDAFEQCSSGNQKRDILAGFAGTTRKALKTITDLEVDRKLLALRSDLEQQHGTTELSFYREPLKSRWKGEEADADAGDAQPTRRTWVIAAGSDAQHWAEWQSQGVATIGWGGIGDLAAYASKDDIEAALSAASSKESRPTNDARACWEFAHEMAIGDRIFAKQGLQRLLGAGVVVGEYVHTADANPQHARKVRWEHVGDWTLGDDNFAPKALTDLTASPEFVARLEELVAGAPPPPRAPAAMSTPYPLAALAEESGFAESILTGWIGRLRRKRQIVLQGPPGTGKTFLAERLARHLVAGTHGIIELVQFHPAYAYEDFVQGIRPLPKGNQITFEHVDGRFLDFCAKARDLGPESPCVLIIDELNRAKLSQVFGELMYLLEYRDRTIKLASGKAFALPDNVHLIGTMNTADRSIALVDHALRRRFSFIGIAPAYEVLARHLTKCGLPADGLVEALKRVNRAIRNPNYELGISFFMLPDATLRGELAAVWQGEIEPYLEEYFYDKPDDVDALRWERVRGELLSDWPA